LTKSLAKKTTHLIWKDGRKKSLLKAFEQGIKIVTPLWLQTSLNEQRMMKESEFAPN
jgi:hypothetical protein